MRLREFMSTWRRGRAYSQDLRDRVLSSEGVVLARDLHLDLCGHARRNPKIGQQVVRR
jgi:hypothetical protein